MAGSLFYSGICILLCSFFASGCAKQANLDGSPIFSVSFDDGFDAVIGKNRMASLVGRHGLTIKDDDGVLGGSAYFDATYSNSLSYSSENVGYTDHDWSGSVSFWLKVDPDSELPAGYSDPVIVSGPDWRDGSMFVDFDKSQPRQFRFGFFPNMRAWNPEGKALADLPASQIPMIKFADHPFNSHAWTHVAWTFDAINSDGRDATVRLYLNGTLSGEIVRPMKIDWDLEKIKIAVGVNYTGYLDELKVFDRALERDEILLLFASRNAPGQKD